MTKSGTTTYYTGGMSHLLKAERKEAGLSLRALAKKSGVSYSTLWRFEHGYIGSVETFTKITNAIGIGLPKITFVPNNKQKANP